MLLGLMFRVWVYGWVGFQYRIIVVTFFTYFINSGILLICALQFVQTQKYLVRAHFDVFYCIYWFLFIKLDFQMGFISDSELQPICVYAILWLHCGRKRDSKLANIDNPRSTSNRLWQPQKQLLVKGVRYYRTYF